MVSTRNSEKRKEEQREALEKEAQKYRDCKVENISKDVSKEAVETVETGNIMKPNLPGPSAAQSVRNSSRRKSTSTSSTLARKKRLELEAAEAKAKIRMELIDKKLEADLAELENEGSSKLSERSECTRKSERVITWLESSRQELKKNVADVLCPAPQESNLHRTNEPAVGTLPSEFIDVPQLCTAPTARENNDATVHALASALKDLAASTNAKSDDKMLNRLCTPKNLPKYAGDPLEWLHFKKSYEESSQVCRFSDRENLWRLRESLVGPAKEAVTALLISATSADEVMATLELQFGNPDAIISKILFDINKLRPLPQEYQKEIISFAVKVRNCVAAITAIGHEDYLKGNNITSVIISKLPIVLISKWTDYSYPLLNNKEKPKLLVMSEFLSEEAKKISMTSVNLSIVHNKQSYSEYVKHRTLYVNNNDGEQSDGDLCRYCHASKHLLQDCKKFKKSLRRDRWTFVKRHGICYKCLTAKHKQDTCPKPVCDVDKCGLPHHRLLHYVTKPNSVQRDSVNITDATASGTNLQTEVVNHLKVNSCKVLLKTVPVYLHGPNGIFCCAALLDDGSTVTLISAALAAKAGLRGNKQSMRVCGAWNNSEVICHSEILELELSNRTGTKFSISARSVENLNLPVQKLTSVDLRSYELMKPEIKSAISEGQYKPEILIGQDNYELLLPLEIIKGTPDDPFLTRTSLGCCLHGRTRYSVEETSTQSTLFLSETESSESERILREIQDEMRQSFAIESVGVTSKPRQNVLDVQAMEHLNKTATLKNGRWYVGIPWKGTFNDMPTSYDHALARLQGVERKIKTNEGFAARYKERINHLFTNDYASKLTETVSPNKIWYLPHFGVDNPNKQKLRLVFDAAAKNKGLCLNDYILTGPDLLISLYGIMLRFREHKIAITADIKDMFLRIKVHENDRDAFRFLWRESPEQQVNTYVMTSLIFGANCSPFVSQFVKNKNTERFMLSKPAAVYAIRQQHYMDDYIDSIPDNKTASELVNDVTYIHKQGGFEIRNWSSNIESVLSDLPEESRRSTSVLFKDGQQYQGERTLGLIWFPENDELGFDVSFKRIPTQILTGEKTPTKREMLRVLMSIFDVYGFLSPITIKGKIMLQDTWRSGISWDDEIPSKIFAKWIEWLSLIRMISKVRLPRHYEVAAGRSERDRRDEKTRARETDDGSTLAPNSASLQPALCYTNLELHIFSDSSPKALCAVGYFRWIDNSDKQKIRVAFVTSKCRVAPVKYVSMPRLELQAAVMAARLADNIISEHRLIIKKKIFWCDSSTVLHWIRNDVRKYKVYVAHRLGEIDELTDVSEWRYIPTKLNIADLATRESCEVEQLTSEWFYGPSFLYEDEESWPGEAEMQTVITGDDLQCVNNISVTPTYLPAVPEPTRFSSWLRLLRSTFFILSFINKCRKLTRVDDGTMMERAENLLLKYSQMKSFPDELEHLKQNERLDKRSKLLTLTPVIDEDGLLRLGGRIDAAPEIPDYVKRPVILDGRCHITHLIVKYYHVKAYHGNQETVVNELKQRYWIIKLRPTVKYISSKCMLCRIKRAQPAPPRMGDLPEGRLAHHQRPFTFTGVDLFGPLEVTVLRRREKRYGVIFTCLTVRAIHLEIVNQLTTDALIMALRRMAARRGWPRYLYSDNGTNLRGADKELMKCVSELDKEKLKERVSTYSASTTWVFIPPASPHWGGAWERLIRSIKTALNVILKERAPREETLLTLMIEVEHIINSRPLTHVAVEPTSKESLTPNHFLLGTTSNLPTLGTFDESDTYLRKQWRISQMLADMFWKRWVREVLPDMRPRKKWNEEKRPLQVGDLVLIVDPNSPRNVWQKGVVQNVIPGRDGRVRVIDVMTKSGLLRRNTSRVARIPIDGECCSSTKGGEC